MEEMNRIRKKNELKEMEGDEEQEKRALPKKAFIQGGINDLDSFVLEKIMSACDIPMMKVLQFVSHQWNLLANKFPQKSIVEYAITIRNLDLLKWAKQNGCPWDEYTCSLAAENGHLEV